MAGVMSLMQPQQGPMPGQAPQQPMQGMMPQQGAATPAAMVGPLTQMHMQQLLQLMLNPRPEGPPLYAVISALAEKQKAAKAAQNAQGQQAMAQNAQMQQQPPVAAQVMQASEQMPQQQTQMAAHGGVMHGYASGGAVSFQTAGAVPPGLMNPDVDEDGLPRGKDERERVIDYNNKIRAAYEQQMKSKAAAAPRTAAPSMQDIAGAMSGRRQLEQFYKPRNPEAYTPEALAYRVSGMSPADAPGRGMAEERVTPQAAPQSATQPSPTTFDISSPSSINALRIAAQDTSLPESERADLQRRISMMEGNRFAQSGVATLTKPQATLTPEEEQSYANRASLLRTRQGLPEDVLTGRQGIATLAAENLAAQRAEREQLAREAKEQRDLAIGRSQRDILSDPRSLLDLAGSIDTRRGQGVGSLARGAAGLLGKREEQAEAARKEFALAQRDQRMLQANERQANMLEMQRQQAIRENDFTRVSQIEDQLATLEMQKSQLLRSRQEHAEKIGLDERRVGAMEAEAVAKLGRPTEIDFFRQDPEGYGRFQAARRGPQTTGERQDLAELKTLQGNLQKQVENYMIPKTQRDAAALQLQQVNAKLAQMAGLGGATVPTGGAIRPSSQAEFDALPKGARYINPADGKEYTKN